MIILGITIQTTSLKFISCLRLAVGNAVIIENGDGKMILEHEKLIAYNN